MLGEALNVVEAARALDPYPGRAGIYRISCEPRLVPVRLRELSEALDRFDRSVARGKDAEALLGRVVRYAARKGIDPRAMMEEVSRDAGAALDDEALAELLPKPGEIGEPDKAQDISVSRQASRDGDPVSGRDRRPAPRYDVPDSFPGQGSVRRVERAADTSRPMDPTQAPEREHEAPRPQDPQPVERPTSDMPLMRKAEDRLKQLADRHGWTPELREIDAALRHATETMTSQDSVLGRAHLLNAAAGRALGRVEREVAKLEAESPEEEETRSFGM